MQIFVDTLLKENIPSSRAYIEDPKFPASHISLSPVAAQKAASWNVLDFGALPKPALSLVRG